MLVTNQQTDKQGENITFHRSSCIGDNTEAGVIDNNSEKQKLFLNEAVVCEYYNPWNEVVTILETDGLVWRLLLSVQYWSC